MNSSGYLSKKSKIISGKNRVVYTGLKGGHYYIKGGKKNYLKKTLMGGTNKWFHYVSGNNSNQHRYILDMI